MINRKRLLEEFLREDDNDIEVEEEKPKRSYRHYLRTLFPENKRYLPIVAEDFCYTMDIMFMRPFDTEDLGVKRDNYNITKKKSAPLVIEAEDTVNPGTRIGEQPPPWTCVLVFVEATSRKAWAYPMHSKNSREVLYCFKKFLSDIEFRISRLISDSGREYVGIVKFNKEHIELPDEPNGLFDYPILMILVIPVNLTVYSSIIKLMLARTITQLSHEYIVSFAPFVN